MSSSYPCILVLDSWAHQAFNVLDYLDPAKHTRPTHSFTKPSSVHNDQPSVHNAQAFIRDQPQDPTNNLWTKGPNIIIWPKGHLLDLWSISFSDRRPTSSGIISWFSTKTKANAVKSEHGSHVGHMCTHNSASWALRCVHLLACAS